MKFTKSLIKGKLVKRYKRFFADIKLNKEIVIAHCPNTGSMKGLLDEGNEVLISKSDDPKRKLKYTLEIIKVKKNLVGVNTHFANKIAHHGLSYNLINELKNNDTIRPEVFFNKETRFDFLIEKNNQKIFTEVKNVTLFREPKIAEFPDTITARGTKHLNELISARKKGYQAYIMYVIQREDCDKFNVAKDIDPEYSKAFKIAINEKVKVICYDCKFSSKGIKLNREIKLITNE